jgi:hypothetical protein
VVLALAALFITVASAAGPEIQTVGDAHGQAWAHGNAGGHGGGGRVNNLTYHGGAILAVAPAITAIYWGDSSAFGGDKVSGLDSLYAGLAGSKYDLTNQEYTDGSGQHVTASVAYNGHLFDTSATPGQDPGTSGVLAEVARKISNPVTNGYYPVYTDIPRGRANYCAWHSWGYVGSTLVQFGFFFKLDGDAGCDPGDNVTGHSQGLAALANVSGHEFSEMLTDAHGDAWYDRQGAENADKCAWHFNGTERLSNGTQWLIQGNWSNNAANQNSGYYNGGCINGN